MKSPATALPYVVEEKGALEATEALRTGDERTLAAYIADLAVALSRLEAALRPTDKGDAALVFSKAKRPPRRKRPLPRAEKSESKWRLIQADKEWDSTLGELEKSLRLGRSDIVASYLHDAQSVLRRLSKALAPPVGSKSKKLTFTNASRGKPVDPIYILTRNSNIRTRMRLAKGKQIKAVVDDLMKEYDLCRSQIFKIAKTS